MANTTYIFCTIDDVRDVLSAAGVTLASDDSPPTAYGNAIAKAGNVIVKYLFRRYDPNSLMQSDLVKDWAAAVAAFKLRTRRGNPAPPGVIEAYQEALEDLKQMKAGVNEIPGISPRKQYAPGLSKMRSTLRPYPRAVVEPSQGTTLGGTPANYHQHSDPWDTFGWNTNAFLDLSV